MNNAGKLEILVGKSETMQNYSALSIGYGIAKMVEKSIHYPRDQRLDVKPASGQAVNEARNVKPDVSRGCKSLRAYHRHNFPRDFNALHATCHTRTARVAHDEGADND